MPGMSVIKMSLITSSVCFLPSLFKACSDRRQLGGKLNIFKKGVDVLCLLIQIFSIGLWTVYCNDHTNVWSISVGLCLTSFGWWEAYLPYDNAIIFKSYFGYLREVRDQSLHKRKQHVVNCIVSLWKIFLILVVTFSISTSLKMVPDISELFKGIHWSYTFSDKTTVTPGKPPAIMINESFSSCNKGMESLGFVPYLTYPDPEDCSGYWIRVCMEEEPTLKYSLCSGNYEYFSDKNSIACFNEGTCCMDRKLVDCTGRNQLDNCPNPEAVVQAEYPSEPTQEWRVIINTLEQKYYPFMILLVQIVATFITYMLSYFSFETRIEVSGFAIPMTLGPLILIPLLATMCNNVDQNNCFYNAYLPVSIFFSCSGQINLADFLHENWIYILTLLSQAWISSHIWTKRSLKLAKAELIFDTPFYDSLLIEQSLLLNRRMDDEKKTREEKLIQVINRNVKVLGCATMWHETEAEMSELIDSILRIDCHTSKYGYRHEDSFDFEMHILFDNAFEKDGQPNEFVYQLIKLLEDKKIIIHEKIITPYGGRLIWKLENQTLLICHLKDKTKIKIKKRWSQLLYFLYFLGQKAVDQLDSMDADIFYDVDKSSIRNQNTFGLNPKSVGSPKHLSVAC